MAICLKKWLFQLDDEPNHDIKSGWKSPFPSIKLVVLGYPGSNLMAISPRAPPRYARVPAMTGRPRKGDEVTTRDRPVGEARFGFGREVPGWRYGSHADAGDICIYIYTYIYLSYIYIYIPTLYMISSIYRFEDWDLDIYTSDMPQCHAYLTYLYQDYHSCFFDDRNQSRIAVYMFTPIVKGLWKHPRKSIYCKFLWLQTFSIQNMSRHEWPLRLGTHYIRYIIYTYIYTFYTGCMLVKHLWTLWITWFAMKKASTSALAV